MRPFANWTTLAMAGALVAAAPIASPAQVIITEIIPTVTTNDTAGDIVELYNAGGAPVSLTNWRLSDADPGGVESNFASEITFAAPALNLPDLEAGEFAVVVFATDTGTASFTETNYGLLIVAPTMPAGSGAFDGDYDQLMLLDSTLALQDSVVWGRTDGVPGSPADVFDDMSQLTQPTSAWFALSNANAWDGEETIADQADYNATDIDNTGFIAVSTYGASSIQRLNTDTTWSQGAPDSSANFVVTPRHRATLGNFTSDVTTLAGLRVRRQTGNLTQRLNDLESSTHPDRRIDTSEGTNRYVEPTAPQFATFRTAIAQMDAGQYEQAYSTAAPLGFEVIEYLDTQTNDLFHLLIEREVPGQPGYIGGGIYVFDANAEARDNLIIQAPHPNADEHTMQQGALALPQLRPRVFMIAGTHRRNHAMLSGCTDAVTDDYRISDVAHVTTSCFHAAHLELRDNVPGTLSVQLHGFCKACRTTPYHVVPSNGIGQYRSTLTPTWLLAGAINAAGHVLPGGAGVSLAGVYDYEADFLGATNNAQGRILNGVPEGAECLTEADEASELFLHIEQSEDVRDDPQHVIDALGVMLDQRDGLAPMPPTATFFSIASEDGWVLEASENASMGSTLDAGGVLRVGDSGGDAAYRTVLSFDTSDLPNAIVVTEASIEVTRSSLTNQSPWGTHGDMVIEVRNGTFGTSAALEALDWQAAPTALNVGVVPELLANDDRETATLDAGGRAAINPTGHTQVKLRFATEDNDDGGSDYVSLATGANADASKRPELNVVFAPAPLANGDADNDGTRDVRDVTAIYNVATGIVAGPLDGDGDVDNDGDVDAADADALVQFLVNGVAIP